MKLSQVSVGPKKSLWLQLQNRCGDALFYLANQIYWFIGTRPNCP